MGIIMSNGENYSGLNLITPECYSTEEREVGCWVDGKPLYQKTLSIPTSSQNTTYDVSSLNIDTCVKIDAFMSGNGSVPDGYWYNSSNYVSVNYYDGDLYINAPTQYSNNSPCIVTLQYTKTTDTAGSGSWTPQGVPAVHYSTEEQVIGTWIDGRALYEKTFNVGDISSGTGKDITHNISNFGHLVKVDGYGVENNGNCVPIPFVDNVDTYQRYFRITPTLFTIGAGNNASALTDCYITIRYTKSS